MSWSTPVIHSVGDVLTASDWNIGSNDLSFLYGDAAWTNVTFQNGWVNLGGDQTVQYRKIGTRVALRGTMKSGTINTVAFNLPVGYRPPAVVPFGVPSNTAFGVFLVASTGDCTPQIGSNVNFAINGVEFDTF